MRNIVSYVVSLGILTGMVSCAGQQDPEGDGLRLVLEADRTEITADGSETVVFTVKNGTEDVTAAASLSCTGDSDVSKVSGGVFSTNTAGTYLFKAEYDGKESNTVSVVATAPFESVYQRHVCVMEFTGTWCAQCPAGATTLDYLVNRAYKNKAYALAFHNDDIYALPAESELKEIFKWGGYPAYVTDMRDSGLLSDGTCGASIETSLYDDQTHCGVAVSCEYDSETSEAVIMASVTSERAMTYRIAAYVIEDKVVGEQTLGDGQVQEDYVHRHMVRRMLVSGVRGESLGEVKAGHEVKKNFTFTVEEGWNLENLSVAVLAINSSGHVNNMAICPVDGGNMDYEYVK